MTEPLPVLVGLREGRSCVSRSRVTEPVSVVGLLGLSCSVVCSSIVVDPVLVGRRGLCSFVCRCSTVTVPVDGLRVRGRSSVWLVSLIVVDPVVSVVGL